MTPTVDRDPCPTFSDPIFTTTTYTFADERSAKRFANGRHLCDQSGTIHSINRGARRWREGLTVYVDGAPTSTWITT